MVSKRMGLTAGALVAVPLALGPGAMAASTPAAASSGGTGAGVVTRVASAAADAGTTKPSVMRANRTAQQVLSSMTLQQRVGELLMMGNPATNPYLVTEQYIQKYHVGSVVLTGRSTYGTAHTNWLVGRLQSYTGTASTGGTKLVVAADQEGGYVQVLQGPGFSRMPTALYQGTHWSLGTIRSNAATWGGQLKSAGVNLDLAPVMDTVSQSFAPYNAPIGYYDREFGYTPYDVLMRGNAFANGLRDAGMGVTIKHFPGLGRVRGNTDTTSGVTDTVTTRYSSSIQPFAVGVRSGAEAVMVSTAYYKKIAPNPAAFSTSIMGTMLRGDLGFTGVIISDDLGNAKQVQAWSPGTRAVLFLQHGGNLILTVNPSTVPAMYNAVLSLAESSSSFRSKVNNSALHVLQLKARLGLIG
ncbi:MAG TPA: glycoside hydrolase family 3 N-terminal domain-containing protein [Segeticoccus sp.]|uniref:glycoside hydrolase family 3 N-terminal domain-containing protein n=1 Tax=Segeticoccus sp. TaxID=2706531 RepID=UPI002D7F1510|nr:glycoside hydrolase family 3 N-terminal domain-containing protein [Segeticoccus sp.]HET8600441.1 glycoside hydrolase family 3 N-terminal domain-containing protein [Segeticoccus sp.]